VEESQSTLIWRRRSLDPWGASWWGPFSLKRRPSWFYCQQQIHTAPPYSLARKVQGQLAITRSLDSFFMFLWVFASVRTKFICIWTRKEKSASYDIWKATGHWEISNLVDMSSVSRPSALRCCPLDSSYIFLKPFRTSGCDGAKIGMENLLALSVRACRIDTPNMDAWRQNKSTSLSYDATYLIFQQRTGGSFCSVYSEVLCVRLSRRFTKLVGAHFTTAAIRRQSKLNRRPNHGNHSTT